MAIKVALQNAQSGWLKRLFGLETRKPLVPDGQRAFAIGDIHGRRDLLEQLLQQIESYRARSSPADTFIFLGDYVDRGPDSKGVIDLILSLPDNWQKIFLLGNHDQSLLDFLRDPLHYRAWRNFGAPETLLSYGVRPPRFDDPNAFTQARDTLLANCPSSHLVFLESLRLSYELGDYLFVHAGIRPGIALNRQRDEDLLWIRDEFLMSDHLSDKVVVHGHTPSEKPIRRPNRLGLDTGAHATGCLTAAVLEGDKVNFLSTGLEARSAA